VSRSSVTRVSANRPCGIGNRHPVAERSHGDLVETDHFSGVARSIRIIVHTTTSRPLMR